MDALEKLGFEKETDNWGITYYRRGTQRITVIRTYGEINFTFDNESTYEDDVILALAEIIKGEKK